MKRKRIIALALALMLLFGTGNALAATGAGTSADPLISLQYLQESFIPAALSRGRSLLGTALSAIGLGESQRATAKVLASGTVLTLGLGDSVTLVTGEAQLQIGQGTVLDLTHGTEVPSGALTESVRYFAAEGTRAAVTLTELSKVCYEGNVVVSTDALPVRFTDVPANHWAYPYIMQLADDGYVNGVGGGLFATSSNMSRRDFVTILGRVSGVDVSAYQNRVFTDVDIDTYYGPYVAWAAENGIVKGYGDGVFGPSDEITRSQMAQVVINYAAFAGIALSDSTGNAKYADDASIEDWAREAVYAARDAGLITGKVGNLFDPRASATRAEVSTVLCRLIYGI